MVELHVYVNSVTPKSFNQNFPCGLCQKWITSTHDRALKCGYCHILIHFNYNGLTLEDYQLLQLSKEV